MSSSPGGREDRIAETSDALKEQCRACSGQGTKLKLGAEASQQPELCDDCHGKGRVYTDVDRTITRLADEAIMRLLGRDKPK